MLKITFDLAPETQNKDEIALYNIKNSIEFLNEHALYHSSIGWILNDKERNFEKLELMYRENNFNAFVRAVKINLIDNFKLTCHNAENLEYAFEVYIGESIENYEENFKLLKNVGFVDMIDKTKRTKNNDILLEQNEIILHFNKMSVSDSIKNLEIELTKELGYKPKIEIIGTFREDVPLLGFKTKEGKYASNLCWFGLKNDKNEYEYYMRDINDFIAKN